ncbi:hypothetical protein TSAR_011633, partial [Trichomalopsis sarcophagae]
MDQTGAIHKQANADGFSETTFDRFQQGVFHREGTDRGRSTEQYEFPPAPLPNLLDGPRSNENVTRTSLGRGARVQGVRSEQNRRLGEHNRSSDMNLDETGPSRIEVRPTSRQRDERRDGIIERLFTQLSTSSMPNPTNNNTVPASSTFQNYQVMPDLSKNIQNFTGNESSTAAKEWLSNIESMCLLHNWPDNFALETARMHLTLGARDCTSTMPNPTNNNTVPASSTFQNYQVMPDLSKNIQNFTGNESSTAAKEWLSNIESMSMDQTGAIHKQANADGFSETTFDRFQQGVFHREGTDRGRSTEQYEFPPAPLPNLLDGPRSNENVTRTSLESRQRDERRDGIILRLFTQLSTSTVPNPTNNNTVPASSTFQNYQVMPDLSKNIQNFTGNESSTAAKEWLSNIESMCLLHNWPDNFALETARMHLTLGARDWFATRKNLVSTWKDFKQTFRKTYVRNDSTTARWKRMTERIQQRGETLQQYFHSKTKLCVDLGLGMSDTKEQILIGLWSRDLYHVMSSRVHGSVDDLLHDMLDYECASTLRAERMKAYNNSNTTTNRACLMKASVVLLNRYPIIYEQSELKSFGPESYCVKSPGYVEVSIQVDEAKVLGVKCPCLMKASVVLLNRYPIIYEQSELKSFGPESYRVKSPGYVEVSIQVDEAKVLGVKCPCLMKSSVVLLNRYPIIYEQSELKSFGPESYCVKSPGYVEVSIQVDEAKVLGVKCPCLMKSSVVLLNRYPIIYEQSELKSFGPESYRVTTDVTIPPLTVSLIETRINEVNHLLPIVKYDTKNQKVKKGASPCRSQLSRLPVMSVHLPREPVKKEDLNVGDEQPEAPTEAVIVELLNIANKYRDCIAFNVFEIGCARGIEVEINEKPGSMP